jgi:threonylcarbamoyladenosine tRNA methylthiotransferase MtaB
MVPDPRMGSFHIENFGCRATQADAAAIERQLLDRGLARGDAAAADVLVVHTCTVTAAADAQARQAIRQLHGRNPNAQIVVTGCYAQRAPEELAQIEGVGWVVGNAHQAEIVRLVLARPAESARENFFPLGAITGRLAPAATGAARILTGSMRDETAVFVGQVSGEENGRTRPTVKIQDGCNNRCAYCILPAVRGPSRSLAPEGVLGEIRRLAAAGAKEVVLSGINLGGYGRDLAPRVSLEELLRQILEETSIDRLRLSSLEPMHLTRELVELVGSSERIARHFHVPLESGSDRILAAMHRWYRAAHYARRVELVAERFSDAAIGSDLIAGFPGETEEDHRATVSLIERLPFTYLHVFPFSARPGTEAAGMPGQVPPAVTKRRARELRELAAEKARAFRTKQAGKVMRLLTLGRTGESGTEAISGNYLTMRLPGRWPANEWVRARLVAGEGPRLLAEPAAATGTGA